MEFLRLLTGFRAAPETPEVDYRSTLAALDFGRRRIGRDLEKFKNNGEGQGDPS